MKGCAAKAVHSIGLSTCVFLVQKPLGFPSWLCYPITELCSRKKCQAQIIRLPLMISAAISVSCLCRVCRCQVYMSVPHLSTLLLSGIRACCIRAHTEQSEPVWPLYLCFLCRVFDEFALGDYPLMHVSERQVTPHCQFSICSMWIIILSCLTWVLWALIS